MAGRKQTKTKDLIMMKPGLRAQIPDSPSLSLASASSRRPLHYTNAGYENAETLSVGPDYEDLDLYRQSTGPRRSPNVVYEPTPSISVPISKRTRQMTECSDDSTSASSIEHYHHSKRTRCRDSILVVIFVVSLVSLALVISMVFGILGPKCSECQAVSGGNTRKSLTAINPAMQRNDHNKISALEKNITAMIYKENIIMELLKSHELTISNLKEKLNSLTTKTQKSTEFQSNNLKNISQEVQALRTKQNNLESSLKDLKSSDQNTANQIKTLDTKVLGMAVNVKFLTDFDSMVKSNMSELQNIGTQTKSQLEALKIKDTSLETALKGLQSESIVTNSSLKTLKLQDEVLKSGLSFVNSTLTSKMKDITESIIMLQNRSGTPGPPGPQGPQGPTGPAGPKGSSSGGGLTGCKRGSAKASSSSKGNSAIAYAIYTVQSNEIVTGVTCSTIQGDETELDFNGSTYVCTCSGQSSYSPTSTRSPSMVCRIDYWTCPKS